MVVFEDENEKVLQAITALKQLQEVHFSEASKKTLFQESKDSLFLQLTLKKIPSMAHHRIVKVALPHKLVKEDEDVCLIVGDLDKRNQKAEVEADVMYYKELLGRHGVTQVTEVVTIRQLRTEYKTFEAQRSLLGAYDIFLCDKKIAGLLPKLLGKNAFKKRKLPIQVSLGPTNIKQQIENAIAGTVFYLTCMGSSCIAPVARLTMSDTEIAQNVVAALGTIAKEIPGGLPNISAAYLKMARSTAIPLLFSYDDPKHVKIPKLKKQHPKSVYEELSTHESLLVKVKPDLSIDVIDKNKKDEAKQPKDHKKSQLRKLKYQKIKKQMKFQKAKKQEIIADVRSLKAEAKKEGVDFKDILESEKLRDRSKIVKPKADDMDEGLETMFMRSKKDKRKSVDQELPVAENDDAVKVKAVKKQVKDEHKVSKKRKSVDTVEKKKKWKPDPNESFIELVADFFDEHNVSNKMDKKQESILVENGSVKKEKFDAKKKGMKKRKSNPDRSYDELVADFFEEHDVFSPKIKKTEQEGKKQKLSVGSTSVKREMFDCQKKEMKKRKSILDRSYDELVADFFDEHDVLNQKMEKSEKEGKKQESLSMKNSSVKKEKFDMKRKDMKKKSTNADRSYDDLVANFFEDEDIAAEEIQEADHDFDTDDAAFSVHNSTKRKESMKAKQNSMTARSPVYKLDSVSTPPPKKRLSKEMRLTRRRKAELEALKGISPKRKSLDQSLTKSSKKIKVETPGDRSFLTSSKKAEVKSVLKTPKSVKKLDGKTPKSMLKQKSSGELSSTASDVSNAKLGKLKTPATNRKRKDFGSEIRRSSRLQK